MEAIDMPATATLKKTSEATLARQQRRQRQQQQQQQLQQKR